MPYNGVKGKRGFLGMTLNNFDDFVAMLLQAGFSTGSGNAEGIYAVVKKSGYITEEWYPYFLKFIEG